LVAGLSSSPNLADEITRDLQSLFLAQEAGEVDAAEFQRRSDEISRRAASLKVVRVGSQYRVIEPGKSRLGRRR
jgi:hypothetical protein